MKFKVGDEVKTARKYDYAGHGRFPVGTIGIVDCFDDCDSTLPYRVYADIDDCDNDLYWYGEDELVLVEEKVEEKKPMKMKGKLGMLLKCGRCGEKEFAWAENADDVELITDLEFDTADTDRWGETGGLSLCPKCAGALNSIIDAFMEERNVVVM